MVNYVRLRQALMQERIAAELTLDALAQRSGLNRATIHSIENVKREPNLRPEFHTINRLVEALGLTLATFFGRLESAGAAPSRVKLPRTDPETVIGTFEYRAGFDPPVSQMLDQDLQVVAAIRRLEATVDRGIRRLLKATKAAPSPGEPVRRALPSAGRQGHSREIG